MGSLIKVQDFKDALSGCRVSFPPAFCRLCVWESHPDPDLPGGDQHHGALREGVCVSENEEKCPVDFFENDCLENKDFCGLTTHRGKWMTLFCKKTCHCLEATDDECCKSSLETQTQQANLIEDHSEDATEEANDSA